LAAADLIEFTGAEFAHDVALFVAHDDDLPVFRRAARDVPRSFISLGTLRPAIGPISLHRTKFGGRRRQGFAIDQNAAADLIEFTGAEFAHGVTFAVIHDTKPFSKLRSSASAVMSDRTTAAIQYRFG
jgi:hypothetical protein